MTDDTLPSDDKILVLLLLLTGSRLEEICQLVSEDITRDRANWTLRLAFGEDTGTDAQLKNSASARRLMIPCGVIPMLDAWLNARCIADGRIFPDLQPDKYGKLSGAVSKRLNARVKKLIGRDKRIVLLSTRPTSGRVLRRANVDPRVRQRQLGHADVSIHDLHYDPAEYFDDESGQMMRDKRIFLPGSGKAIGQRFDTLETEQRRGWQFADFDVLRFRSVLQEISEP